jgi:hypothetical protein
MTPAIEALAGELAGATRRREPLHRRTNQKVRGGSRYGRNLVPNSLDRRMLNQVLGAVRDHIGRTRTPGKRRGGPGTLSPYDEKVLMYLYDLAVRFEGRVFPTIAKIAEELGLSPSTVNAAKRRLKACGLIEWTRRCEPKEGMQGLRGPQVEQISNWYHLLVPGFVKAIWEAWRRRKERPTDDHLKARFLRMAATALQAERLRRITEAPAADCSPAGGSEREVT